jgi:hypothetical protein
MKFFDDNTRSWWTPATGGANVPALNELLAPHGVALGDAIVQGSLRVAGMDVPVRCVGARRLAAACLGAGRPPLVGAAGRCLVVE